MLTGKELLLLQKWPREALLSSGFDDMMREAKIDDKALCHLAVGSITGTTFQALLLAVFLYVPAEYLSCFSEPFGEPRLPASKAQEIAERLGAQ